MAMIYCKECGKEISDKADKCPHCGCPMQSTNAAPQTNSLKAKEGKVSGLSITALIFSILGCTFIIGIILAIIDLCIKDGRKKTCSIIALVISGIWLVIGVANAGNNDKPTNSSAQKQVSASIKDDDTESNNSSNQKEEVKEKYNVGDTWENKTLRMNYTSCYEFTYYNQYNSPADGNKIICAEFEFENIGSSDATVMYTDFHGYADGYEVEQSYAPDGTGLDFSVKMSAGRKGTGKVAFEVSEDAQEIEIEFSPNMFSSEKVIFVYE